ncbi:MAG: hypothetical protein H7Y42_00080 [Chitinophagaceae bacterium]|nr:hypothetical protein [Chitinophagaceae bacterium]
MKKLFVIVGCLFLGTAAMAQDEEEKETGKSFREHLFTGGSVSLAFYNNTFLIGASPVFGYSLSKFADAGLVVNYNYTSYRDVNVFDDRLRQSVYGGGVFAKLYPVRFLFVQAQFEHNFIKQKYMPPGGASSSSATVEANSFLIGGGYTTNRHPDSGEPFFYLAVLFDIADNAYSPYTDSYGRTIPIVRAGVQIPLFQK